MPARWVALTDTITQIQAARSGSLPKSVLAKACNYRAGWSDSLGGRNLPTTKNPDSRLSLLDLAEPFPGHCRVCSNFIELFVSFGAFCSNSLPAFCKGPLERRLLGWRSQRIQSRAATEGIVKRLTKVTQARVAYFQRGLADVEFARP